MHGGRRVALRIHARASNSVQGRSCRQERERGLHANTPSISPSAFALPAVPGGRSPIDRLSTGVTPPTKLQPPKALRHLRYSAYSHMGEYSGAHTSASSDLTQQGSGAATGDTARRLEGTRRTRTPTALQRWRRHERAIQLGASTRVHASCCSEGWCSCSKEREPQCFQKRSARSMSLGTVAYIW